MKRSRQIIMRIYFAVIKSYQGKGSGIGVGTHSGLDDILIKPDSILKLVKVLMTTDSTVQC